MSNIVRFIHHNHFDPIWRRCWQRPILEQGGRTIQPYAVVEAAIINRWVELAEAHGHTFGEGQACVWRSYFQRHPERLEQVRGMHERGLLDLFACGEVIADSNMPSGEAYVRNMLLGLLSMEEIFGPAGRSPIGWLFDAFGNAAQVPQIMRQLGVEMIFRLCYAAPGGEVWRGLDGTEIRVSEPWPQVNIGQFDKIPPCPDCEGKGCDVCGETGLHLDFFDFAPEVAEHAGRRVEAPVGMVFLTTEECLPSAAHAEGLRRLREAGVDAKFGTYRELLELCPIPPDGKVGERADLNPANTGCYVTRIRCKQRVRELEHRLMSLEFLAAALGRAYDPAALQSAWRTLSFTLFHDAITGTHVDAAYFELMEMFDDVERDAERLRESLLGSPTVGQDPLVLTYHNPLPWARRDDVAQAPADLKPGVYHVAVDGQTLPQAADLLPGSVLPVPAVAAHGKAVLTLTPTTDAAPVPEGALENEHLRITHDERWLTGIVCKADGRAVHAAHPRLRPLDLTAEPDYGDPWTTFLDTTGGLYTWSLSPYVRDARLEAVAGGKRLRFQGQYDGENKYIDRLAFQVDFLLWDNAPYLDVHLAIDWDTRSTRLRLNLPVASGPRSGLYEVPFGSLERAQYRGTFQLVGTNGDWPAQTWVDVAAGDGQRLALFNNGTPSHRVHDGVLSCSILRSPDAPTMLNETGYYEFHGHDGMRDAGRHAFRFRLWPHAPSVMPDELTQMGVAFNAPLLPGAVDGPEMRAPFRLEVEGVVPVATKRSEDGTAWIVRLVELRGQETSGTFAWLGQGSRVEATTLLEREGAPLGAVDEPISLSFQPFEIKTLRIV